MKRFLKPIFIAFAVLLGLCLILEIGERIYVEAPLKTDFYGSIPRDKVRERQEEIGVRVAKGPDWVHLGWIADPEREYYRIERLSGGTWEPIGKAKYGSFLLREGGTFRVLAIPKNGADPRIIGEVSAEPDKDPAPIFVPRIAGPWRLLFRPQKSGYYVNDHTIFQDAEGNWRLIGITSKTNGDPNQEKYFAVGVSKDFPPASGMIEAEPIADFGELAWAPYVLHDGTKYHMFWSPHKLHQMGSKDGVHWENHRVTISAPMHKFFRDPMVLQVAPGQWLLYTTARGTYYSQVDIYQSFNLTEWQYIGTALRSSWGSERNSPFASMESPFVINYKGRYYLSLTYNNDSFFLHGLLMQFRIWLNKESYNETLVFHSDNPYDFGVYRGRNNSPSLLTILKAHAPEIVYNPANGSYYITTAGWPWAATLTKGEVAVAPLVWEPLK